MPRRPSQSEWERFIGRAHSSRRAIINNFLNGHITLLQLQDEFYNFLVSRHEEAGYKGRRRGGDFSARGESDTQFGRDRADEENFYLQRFISDIESQRYTNPDGTYKRDAIQSRAGQYVSALHGTANEAFSATAREEDRLYWVYTPGAEHCSECPALAEGSPYLPGNLLQYPGDGNTECGVNCKCHIRRERGNVSGFLHVDG